MSLILASGSKYRQQQLRNLGFVFKCVTPDIDESSKQSEPHKLLCMRLAQEKAQKVAGQFPDAIVIGADQVCVFQDERMGKPGSVDKAITQLSKMSGQSVLFHSAVAVAHKEDCEIAIVTTEVVFKKLTFKEIERYVALDNPIDCAGAIKSESRGSLLLERVSSDDPSALIGLPLIQTAKMLRAHGINPLAD